MSYSVFNFKKLTTKSYYNGEELNKIEMSPIASLQPLCKYKPCGQAARMLISRIHAAVEEKVLQPGQLLETGLEVSLGLIR